MVFLSFSLSLFLSLSPVSLFCITNIQMLPEKPIFVGTTPYRNATNIDEYETLVLETLNYPYMHIAAMKDIQKINGKIVLLSMIYIII